MILRWAWRELRNNRFFVLFFVLNFGVGLVGFIGLDSFKRSLTDALQKNSKMFLSADFAISARRQISKEELEKVKKKIPEGTPQGKVWELFSMVNSGKGARLVSLKAVDTTYPFYGEIRLASGRKIYSQTVKEINNTNVVWPYQELLTQLGLKVGDEIKLGNKKFIIGDTVVSDSTQTFRLSTMAPRIYLGIEQMAATGLINYGSTMSEAYLFKLPDQFDSEALVKFFELDFTDANLQFQSPKEASEDNGRVLGYLTDYLGLASLVALFLAALGTGYLFRSYLSKAIKSIAILNALGLTLQESRRLYLTQLVILGLFSAILSLLGSAIFFPFLAAVLKTFSPVEIGLSLSWQTVVLSLLMGTVGAVAICYPLLKSLDGFSPAALFRESTDLTVNWRPSHLLWFLPGLIFYWSLSVWQANSLQTGTVFAFAFLACFLVLGLLGRGVQRISRMISFRRPWELRHGILSFERKTVSGLVVVISIGLGALLINLMPQLKENIRAELEAPDSVKLPSLFMFDIQDDQVARLTDFLKKENTPLSYISAMVRGRVLRVNGKNYERNEASEYGFKTREEEQQARFRNRGINLSYRDQLSSSEQIVAGQFYKGSWQASAKVLPELSVEVQYAERLGLKLQDRLTFDVQGIEVEAVITSFRKVRWNSFQPNFFIIIQPGVFDEAPKTFLGAVPKMAPEKMVLLQAQLVDQFPNISMIDVGRTVKSIFEISERMSWSLRLMAMLSLIAGFVVLYSIATHQVAMRRWDLNMLKVLGASRGSVLGFLVSEFIVVGTIGAIFGVGLSFAVSYLLSYLLFDGQFTWTWQEPLITIFGVIALSALVSAFASFRVVRERAVVLLRQ